MKAAQKKLWQRIEETPLCQFGDDHLLKRVCKHTKWTLDHAREVAKEYRKFLFLATQIPYVVPSKQVDEVWHEHLLFTFDYWEIWGQILGKKLHHFPAGPSKKTVKNLQDSYQKTLEAYKAFFGKENPSIWPGRKLSARQKPSSDRGSNNYSPTGAGSCGIVPLMLPGSLIPTHAEASAPAGMSLVGEGNHTGGGFGGHSSHSDGHGHSDGGNTDAGGHSCSSGDGGGGNSCGGGGCGGGCGS